MVVGWHPRDQDAEIEEARPVTGCAVSAREIRRPQRQSVRVFISFLAHRSVKN